MKKFLLYGHGGSYNHGAEAIIRTTVQLIREKYPNSNIILSSNFAEQDLEYGLDKIVDEIIALKLFDDAYEIIQNKLIEIREYNAERIRTNHEQAAKIKAIDELRKDEL